MKKAAAISYVRVSSAGQVEGDGLARQRAAIARRAKALGLEVLAEFRDEGVSGTLPVQERPGFADLVDRIAGNGARVVLVERADRLARDLIESELGLRLLRELGVQVIEAEGGNDLTSGDQTNPTAVLVRQILGAVAQFEKSALVAKLKAARTRKRRKTGRCEGAKPYGHYPGEKRGLELMKRLNRKPRGGQRRSLRAIAEALDEAQVPTRRGRGWTAEAVRQVLARGSSTSSTGRTSRCSTTRCRRKRRYPPRT